MPAMIDMAYPSRCEKCRLLLCHEVVGGYPFFCGGKLMGLTRQDLKTRHRFCPLIELLNTQTVVAPLSIGQTKGGIMIAIDMEMPEHCYECSISNDATGACQADEQRRQSHYRPHWCPLHEVKFTEDEK